MHVIGVATAEILGCVRAAGLCENLGSEREKQCASKPGEILLQYSVPPTIYVVRTRAPFDRA